MKRILYLLLIGLLFPFAAVVAQEKSSAKAGKGTSLDYLPAQGDWSLGVDVSPLLKYFGTMFSDAGSGDLKALGGTPFIEGSGFAEKDKTLVPNVSVMGKYFLSNHLALRANIGFKVGLENKNYYAWDDRELAVNPLGEKKVENCLKQSREGVSVLLGAEYRKGKSRVQGVFGAGLLFAFMNDRLEYSYGNEMTTVNQLPSGSVTDYPRIPNRYRVLSKYNTGANFYTGLTGSAGVEWFMAPKVSLGAEVNMSVYYLFGMQTYIESEGYNTVTGSVEKRTDLISPGDRGFYAATESLGGALTLNFYF